VEVYSIAGRSKEKVESFARKHGIKKVYSGPDGYQGNLLIIVVPLNMMTDILD